jgi:urate oxidase
MGSINPLAPPTDTERERLDRIRKAVADGTYEVSAEALATKLLQSMSEFDGLLSLVETRDHPESKVNAPQLDQAKGSSTVYNRAPGRHG